MIEKVILIIVSLFRYGEVTVLGQQMVEFPLSPGLARALIRSAQLNCEDAMLPIAAMLSVENVFVRSGEYLRVGIYNYSTLLLI